jgi:hypothetical protein
MEAILLVPLVPPALNLNGRDITSTLSKSKSRWLKIECAAKWNAKSWLRREIRDHPQLAQKLVFCNSDLNLHFTQLH